MLVTSSFELAADAIEIGIERRAIICFYGEAGNGKSYAARTVLGEYPEVENRYLDLPCHPSPKQVAAALSKELTGENTDLTLSGLNDLLIDELTSRHRVIVVDEAQRLGYEALEFLRHLHDEARRRRRDTGGKTEVFTLLLVGGHACYQVLTRYPMLESRVLVWVRFEELNEDEVVALIPQFHPLYHNVDETLLRMIDEEGLHGNLRRWEMFTVLAVPICKRLKSPLTEEIARQVFRFWQPKAA